MARGQQKIQSQQKNAKKAAEKKKSQGADQKSAAKAALVHTCPVCRVSGQCHGVLFLLYLLYKWLDDRRQPIKRGLHGNYWNAVNWKLENKLLCLPYVAGGS